LENQVNATEEKSIALTLWGIGGSRRSLCCSIDKNDYLDLVHSSIVKRKNNMPVASISLIKRSYLFNQKKIIFYAMHRMIAFNDSGNLIFNILASILSQEEDHFIATTANKKGTALYKSLGFVELEKRVFLHTYILNPIYLPLLLIFSSITTVKRIIFRLSKEWLPNFYKKNYLNRLKNRLNEHIKLRNSDLSKVADRTYLDWDCPTLIKYLNALMKSYRIHFYKMNESGGKKFSLLITTRFNHIWRSCTIADSTYTNIKFSDILKKYRSLLVLSCLNNGAIRLYIRSLDSQPPLKCGSFIHLKKQTSLTLIRNGKGYFSNLSEDDLLSSLHGDSFL
tara:strand:+ start:1081 stop:2091 length:1011 start_codon:yes stop_codon:yes gene_type:complete